MKHLQFLLLILCLGLIQKNPTVAQEYNFKNYSLEEGLPQSEVFSLIQDKKGNLWLGTNGGGITRFNGKRILFLHQKTWTCRQ